MQNMKKFGLAAAAVVTMGLAGCGGGSGGNDTTAQNSPVFNGNTVGLTANGLVTFTRNEADNVSAVRPVTGLQGGETLLAADVRPADGNLYAISNQRRLYRINTTTGAATAIGGQFPILLNGTSFGVDFNPVVDQLRVVSNTGQNFRVNPTTGAVIDTDAGTAGTQIDPSLAYVAGDPAFGQDPVIVAVAYTNSFAGAADTQLIGIDAARDTLVSINTQTGGVSTIGTLGAEVGSLQAGFDIVGTDNPRAVAVILSPTNQPQLLSINLATGRATVIDTFGNNNVVGVTTLQ